MAVPAILLFAAACAGNDITKTGPDASDLSATEYRFPPAATVTVSPAATTVAVGGSIALGTTLYDSKGKVLTGMMGAKPQWKSSDTLVAKVSSGGQVTGRKDGRVTITAFTSTASGTSTVTVGKGPALAPVVDTTPTAPAPTAPAAPAPSAPATSTGVGLSGKQMVGDDFTSYNSTSDLMARITKNIVGGTATTTEAILYSDGVNANLAEIDKSVLYNGHPTMKYNQPGGISSTPELWARLPKATSKIWFRTHIRFSPGYTTKGTLTNSSNAYKLLGWGWSGIDGSGRLEITNTTQYDFYWNMQSRTTGQLVGGGEHSSAGNVSTEWSDGAWYTYIIEVDHSASNSGVTRVYMARGDAKPTLRATTGGSLTTQTMPQLTYVFLGLNFNQVRAVGQNQAIWYGDWEVVDGTQYADPFGVK